MNKAWKGLDITQQTGKAFVKFQIQQDINGQINQEII